MRAIFDAQCIYFLSQATRTFSLVIISKAFCVSFHTFIVLNAIAEVSSSFQTQSTEQSFGQCGHLVVDQEKCTSSHLLDPDSLEMYGASGIPELIPPTGPPRQAGPEGQYNPGHPQVNGGDGGANPQRLGQRAPKLGAIGRTKKVDLDDEDLDDIMNNNGQCPVSLSPIS